MRRILTSFILLIVLVGYSAAQEKSKIHITFFGSSVCYGASAENAHGYGWQIFNNGAIDTLKFKYFNASTGGDNTLRVERADRITKKLLPTDPDIVVIGLSLGNEGISRTQDNNGRELIMEQFRSRMLSMADSFTKMGMHPVIVNCYAHSHFSKIHHDYTIRMNRIINTWDYPSVNVLGTIDDWKGKWVEGYVAGPAHPNTEGHKEMSYAFVPSLFDAILQGKPIPAYDWNRSYNIVLNEKGVDQALFLDIGSTMHSFTLSFRFKLSADGSIAGYVSGGKKSTIELEGDRIHYKGLSVIFPKHLKSWTHVVLSHSYANEKTMLFVNGELVGYVDEQLSPSRIFFGGDAPMTELKDLTLHRSCLNIQETLDLYNKKFIQSSLQLYSPLSIEVLKNNLENRAQSLSKLNVNRYIELEYARLKLY